MSASCSSRPSRTSSASASATPSGARALTERWCRNERPRRPGQANEHAAEAADHDGYSHGHVHSHSEIDRSITPSRPPTPLRLLRHPPRHLRAATYRPVHQPASHQLPLARQPPPSTGTSATSFHRHLNCSSTRPATPANNTQHRLARRRAAFWSVGSAYWLGLRERRGLTPLRH